MIKIPTAILLFALSATGFAGESHDPLRAALEESRATGKGLSLYVNGVAIPGVVVSVDNGFVIARSQSQGSIVVRLERIDAVAGFVGQAGLERKPQ